MPRSRLACEVLVAGAGIAGVEAALALRALAPEAQVTLLAGDRFTYPPAATALVVDPALRAAMPLRDLLSGTGIGIEPGALAGVRAGERIAVAADGSKIPYRHLVIAVGARRDTYLGHRALTFAGPQDAPAARRLLNEVSLAAAAGVRTRLAFVVPPGPGWPLPAYELALLAAGRLERESVRERVGIAVVTAEDAPLALFGPAASDAVALDLARAGIALRTSAPVARFAAGRLELIPDGALDADRVVALPRLRGPGLRGVPVDRLGFVRADAAGRVRGARGVYVVGDAGSFPIKHGGLACAQADAVAGLIARALGAPVAALSPDETLRAFLHEGEQQRYLRSDPTGGRDDSAGITRLVARQAMSAKVAARYLAPLLDARLAAPGPGS